MPNPAAPIRYQSHHRHIALLGVLFFFSGALWRDAIFVRAEYETAGSLFETIPTEPTGNRSDLRLSRHASERLDHTTGTPVLRSTGARDSGDGMTAGVGTCPNAGGFPLSGVITQNTNPVDEPATVGSVACGGAAVRNQWGRCYNHVAEGATAGMDLLISNVEFYTFSNPSLPPAGVTGLVNIYLLPDVCPSATEMIPFATADLIASESILITADGAHNVGFAPPARIPAGMDFFVEIERPQDATPDPNPTDNFWASANDDQECDDSYIRCGGITNWTSMTSLGFSNIHIVQSLSATELVGGLSSVCGNGSVEAGEDCDPPKATCSIECQNPGVGFGACCNGTMCTVTHAPACSGNYVGDGTDCSIDHCAVGACCTANGQTCNANVPTLICAASGGIPHPGQGCTPNCCVAPASGDDQCENALPGAPIPVPGTQLRSGNSETDSVNECLDLSPYVVHWESFTINSCATVTIDFCCTSPVRSPLFTRALYNGCPCGTLFLADGYSINFTGGTLPPRCDDGNWHAVWNDLPPGTYYYPIFVDDTMGLVTSNHDYTMHIATSACATGRCCLGSSCMSNPLDRRACDCLGGFWGGAGSVCFPPGVCGIGACCIENECSNQVTAAGCAASGGTFFNGQTCFVCVGGSNDGTPCTSDASCAGGGQCIQPNVQCEPPTTPDICEEAIAIGDGVTDFSNVRATTDPVPEPACAFEPDHQLFNDVWFNYIASCSGLLRLDTCGGCEVDTRIAVYGDCACPPSGAPLGCDDNDDEATNLCGGTQESVLTVPVSIGQCYKIRVGLATDTASARPDELRVRCQSIGFCGDGALNVGEECDDGNTTGGDGCSENCEREGACCNGGNSCACELRTSSDCGAQGGTFLGIEALCAHGPTPTCDCNGNGMTDDCDIANGTSFDCDGNGTLDECESHGAFNIVPALAIPECDGVNNQPVSDSRLIENGDCAAITHLALGLQITHTFVGDLVIDLTHDDGQSIEAQRLISRVGVTEAPGPLCADNNSAGFGNSSNDIDILLQDAAIPVVETGPFPLRGTYKPFPGSLSEFNGRSMCGIWTIAVQDGAGLDIGTLEGWSLFFERIPEPSVVCDDGNLCTSDRCYAGTGCANEFNSDPCDDGDACTIDDVCDMGVCAPGSLRSCDDGNPCTDDSCDSRLGCLHVNNANACDDLDVCTTGDACVNGTCQGETLNCDDQNPCTDDGCDPSFGCSHVSNFNACDDNNACTLGDACLEGTCVPGAPRLCDDANPCTDDGCDPASGCTYVFSDDPCPPIARAGGPYEFSSVNALVTLDATASRDPNGTTGTFADIAAVQWDLGDDGIADDALRVNAMEPVTLAEAVAKGLTIASTLPVALNVTDVDGLESSDSTYVQYQSAAPTVAAGGPYGPIGPGQSLTFMGMVDDTDLPLGVGEHLTVEWDFAQAILPSQVGDGFAVGAQPDVSYEDLIGLVATRESTVFINVADAAGLVASDSAELTLLVPDLTVTVINPPPVVFSGGQASISWMVSNLGDANASSSWIDRVYLSADAIPGGDTLLAEFGRSGGLAAGSMYSRSESISISFGTIGEYYLIVTTDALNEVPEPDGEGNNSRVAAVSTLVVLENPPDLQVTQLNAPAQGYANSTMTVGWTVSNAAPVGAANGPWLDRLYLSSDDQLSPPPMGQDILLAQVTRTGTLGPGASYNVTANASLPDTSGPMWLILAADATDVVEEHTGDFNNTFNKPLLVLVPEYAASVQADIDAAVGPTLANPVTVSLTGHAYDLTTAQPATDVPVTIRVGVAGTRRVYPVMSGPDGGFSYAFNPLPNEAGSYSVFADHPAVMENPAVPQDSFILVGLRPEPASLTRNVLIGTPLTGTVMLRNLGDTTVTGIAVTADGTTGYVSAQASVPTTLMPHGSTELAFTLIASGLPDPPATPTVISLRVFADVDGNNIEVTSLPVTVFVVSQVPHLSSSIQSLNATMPIGQQTVVHFAITNDGGAAATGVQVFVPCAPNPGCVPGLGCATTPANCPAGLWLNMTTPVSLGDFLPGQSRAIELALQPTAGLPLGNYTGQIIVQSNETSLNVPFTLRAISSLTGDLFIQVQDELTYYDQTGFINGTGPLVAGASVRLFDIVDQSLVFEAVTDSTGTMAIHDKPTGFYELEVSAPNHGTARLGVYVAPDQETPVAVFLPSQAVTITWIVVPTDIPDEYLITIEADFETNVPVPAITFDPPIIDFDLLPGETRQIDLRITNHGLINAENVVLALGSPDGFTVTALVEQIGVIGAGQELIVPVTIEADPVANAALGSCDVVSGLTHSVHCDIVRYYWTPLYYRCKGIPGGGCPPSGCFGGFSGPGGGGGGGGGPSGGGSSGNPTNGMVGPPGGSNNNTPNAPYSPPPPYNAPPPPDCAEPPLQMAECPPEKCPKADPSSGCCGNGQAQSTAGHPIRLATGEWYESYEDLRIPGRGMDFVWSREYRSQIGPDTPQGNGWDTSYNVFVERDGPDVVLCNGIGRRDVYKPRPDNTWSRSEFFTSIARNPDGTYRQTFSDTGQWNFHAVDGSPESGRLSAIVDRNGNTISLHYDGGGRLHTITDTLGRDIQIAYNSDGFIESVTDFVGRQVRYEYYQNGDVGGSFGDLKSVTVPSVTGTPNANDFPLGKTTVYTYSKGFADERLNHNLLTITDAKGQLFLRNIYHPTTDANERNFDRVIRQIWGNQGPTPELTDAIDLVYVPQVPSVANGQSVMKTIVNDRVGNVSEYDFDIRNRLIRKREFTGRANPDLPTTLSENRPVGQLRPNDPPYYETTYGYNNDSMLTVTNHPNGNITRNFYELDLNPNASPRTRGNLREVRHQPGTHMPVGDQQELVETFEYDTGMGSCCGSNFVKRHVDARGGVTLHDYDDHGNRIKTTHRISSIVEDFEYNDFGQLKAHIHPDNGSGHRRRDEFTYYQTGPPMGYLQYEIVDAPGFALARTYEYDAVGNITRIIDPAGHDTIYSVNQLNQIVRESSAEVTSGTGIRYQKDFFYDDNNNIVRIDVQNIDEFGALQPNAQFTKVFEFDILNHLTRKCEEVGSFTGAIPGTTDLPTCVGLPDSEFITTEYAYDANRNRTLVRYGEAVEGRQPANLVRTLYDERDMAFRIVRAEGHADQSSTQFDYDRNGNQVALREGLEDAPRVSVSTFDAYDRMTQSLDPMGNVTTWHYDANGNRVSERLDGELTDIAGGEQNIRLSQVTYIHDAMDRLTRTDTAHFDVATQSPIGDGLSVSQTFYTDNSQVFRVVNDNNHATVTDYDTANRRNLVTDAKGNSVLYGYDHDSNVTSIIQTEKSDLGTPDEVFTTTYGYDGLDRLTSTTDNVGNTNVSHYDSRNNRVRTVDALGNMVTYDFDGLNRLTTTTRAMTDNGNSSGNPIGTIVTSQVWDDSSRLTQQIDDNGNATVYGFDPHNRQNSETYADGTAQSYVYDVHDNGRVTTDANGSVVTANFDMLNRLIGKTIIPGPGVSNDTTFETFKFDGASRLVLAQDDDSLVTRAHDSLSQSTRETLNGKSTVSAYDGVGNVLSCAYPGGRIVTTGYDELERKKTIVDQNGPIATYHYVGPDRVTRRDYGNGTRTVYQYDGIMGIPNPVGDFGVKYIVRTTHTRVSDGNVIDDRTFTWDRIWNKTQRKDVRIDGPQLTHDYSYDSIYRMNRSVKDSPTISAETIDYSLDGVGNRNTVSGGPDAGAYTLDMTLPEPADYQVNQYTIVPTGQRLYDRNGNLLTVDSGVPTQRTIIYDYRNRMVAFDDPANGVSAIYDYDALGRRIQKIVNNGTAEITRYFLTGWQEIEEQDSSGATQSTYLFGNYIDEVLTMRRSGMDYFYHADDLYNVSAVSDSSGNTVERYEYGDYGASQVFSVGEAPLTTSAIKNELLFTGRRFDPETEWYFYRTRYLDTAIGKFTARDAIGVWGDDSTLGNAVVYTKSSPWTYADSLGLIIEIVGDNAYKKQVQSDIQQLKVDDPFVKQLIDDLEQSANRHRIQMPNTGQFNEHVPDNFRDATTGKGSGSDTKYDPGQWKTSDGTKRNPRVGLAHELSHANDTDQGILDLTRNPRSKVRITEEKAVRCENKVRAATGDAKRTHYGALAVENP